MKKTSKIIILLISIADLLWHMRTLKEGMIDSHHLISLSILTVIYIVRSGETKTKFQKYISNVVIVLLILIPPIISSCIPMLPIYVSIVLWILFCISVVFVKKNKT